MSFIYDTPNEVVGDSGLITESKLLFDELCLRIVKKLSNLINYTIRNFKTRRIYTSLRLILILYTFQFILF